ncbi:hypothetical protein GCM10008959_37080 [Deinococcus seoulensis]|uniref:PKD/Chitinase domain-containing protein n=1 Tax=Deinococcus seoulensis TaxID=1837379 RepID=A0ABQ2RW83_9DEIO|nr:Ig-like domain-containing protein [Deinococcus seoulensis]GGR72070.1 hypothetical protein GCM10008959_37080 [Deinococcus seoulensis]
MKRFGSLSLLTLTAALTACGVGPVDLTGPTLTLSASFKTVNTGTTVTFTANANDPSGVDRVEFYKGTTLIATDTTAPYTTSATYTAADNGTQTITAKAYDNGNNVSTASETVTVNISTAKPAASVTASASTLINAGSVTFTATATDDIGVTKVEFYDNGKLIATDTTAPYSASAAYTVTDNGVHTIMVKAYDADGNVGEASTTVTIAVDSTAPTVSLVPSATTIVSAGTVTFDVKATDNTGVTKVEFYDNGKLIATDTAAPYSASAAYAFADNGTHAIMVKAYDASGNVGEASATVTVAIADANEPNDSVAAATTLTVGTPIKGAIAAQGRDHDYFKFTAAAGEMLKLTVRSVSVDAASTLDPYVMILMPDGVTVLEKDDDSGNGMESEIRFNAPVAGTYTAVVTSFDIHDSPTATDDRATNTYQIDLTRR